MLSLAHTIISLPFGLLPLNPWLIFLLAFLFHLALDGLLHWNIYPPQHNRFPFFLIGLDITLGLLASFILLGDQFFTLPVLSAILGGNIPDILQSFWSFTGKPTKGWWRYIYPLFHFHDKIQWETTNIPLGLVSQIILISIVITNII